MIEILRYYRKGDTEKYSVSVTWIYKQAVYRRMDRFTGFKSLPSVMECCTKVPMGYSYRALWFQTGFGFKRKVKPDYCYQHTGGNISVDMIIQTRV